MNIISTETWMENIAPSIAAKPLRAVIMPGTHDSGTSLIDSYSGLSPDAPGFPLISLLPKPLYGPTIAAFSKTQPTPVLEQLRAGIRYLDLRACMVEYSQELFIVHSMYSHALSQVLSEIQRFVDATNREIVIVDLQTFYQMDLSAHQRLAKSLLSRFRNRLVPRSAGPLASVQTCWDNNWRIILFYGEDAGGVDAGASAITAAEPLFWSRSSLRSKWQDTDDLQTLKGGLDAELSHAPANMLFVLQAVLSPNEATIRSYLQSGSPRSLEDMAGKLAPHIPAWIGGDWATRPLNIVIVDWYTKSDFVGACISSNMR